MAWIIDYPIVLERMHRMGLRCLYYNSGAFGFTTGAGARTVGWLIGEDASIRAEARSLAMVVTPPTVDRLAELAVEAWTTLWPGPVWITPRSHWAYELDFGSRPWLPEALERLGLDPGMLLGRNNGSAIELRADEGDAARFFIRRLLEMLQGSDFQLTFPDRPAVATIHHHQQIWWSAAEAPGARALRDLAGGEAYGEAGTMTG